MLQCEASLSIALGYRELKPAVVGTCALPDTELAGRYGVTSTILKQRIDLLEAGLSRQIPQFSSAIRPV